jgi:hypothetical protein
MDAQSMLTAHLLKAGTGLDAARPQEKATAVMPELVAIP